jgi:cytoskeleton protein RodZ
MNQPVQSVGERLKAARVAAGMTAQRAADALHLDPWVVEALECEDYGRLGPSVYAKGHMKRYAGLLGLPADEILEAAYARPAGPAAADSQPKRSARAAAPALRLRPHLTVRRPSWVGLAAAIFVALGVAAPYLRRPSMPSTAPAAGPAPAATPAPSGSAAPIAGAAPEGGPAHADLGPSEAPPASAAVRSNGADQRAARLLAARGSAVAGISAGDADAVISGTGRAKLRLRFSADSWVYVRDAAGRRLFAGNGRANSVTTIAGDAPMKVYLGFASGVQLEVNNRVVAIGPQFVAGDVARFEAGADGVLRRDAHPVTASNPHPRG